MNESIKVGDSVQPNHGGRHMTIEMIDSGVHCLWHDDAGNIKRDVFPAATLHVIASPKSPGSASKVGDPVQLSHGGRHMTIEMIDSLGVHCFWHDDVGNTKRDVFPAAALRGVSPTSHVSAPPIPLTRR